MSGKLTDLIPSPGALRAGEDNQAFGERLAIGSGLADRLEAVLEFAAQGHHGMALYVAGRCLIQAGNRAPGPVIPDRAGLPWAVIRG